MERLINHLKPRPKRHNICRLNYLDFAPIYSVEEAILIDSELQAQHRQEHAAAMRRHKAILPCYKLSGPLIPINHVLKPSKHSPFGKGHNYCL